MNWCVHSVCQWCGFVEMFSVFYILETTIETWPMFSNSFQYVPNISQYFPNISQYFPNISQYFPIFPKHVLNMCGFQYSVLIMVPGWATQLLDAWGSHGNLQFWRCIVQRDTHTYIYIYYFILSCIYIYTIRFFKLCECLYIYIQLIIYIAWSTSNIAGLLFGSPWQSPPFLLYTARLFRHVLMALFMAESSSQNLRRSILTCPTNWMGSLIPSHMLHVWYIYLHLGDF